MSADASFVYKDCPDQFAKIQSIHSITTSCFDKQIVSTSGYINSENCYVTELMDTTRKGVYLNDATGITTLSIWGSSIEKVSKDSVYNIFNLAVREINTFEGSKLVLSTTDNSEFETPSKSTKIQKIKPTFSLFRKVQFPISACCPVLEYHN